MDTPVQTAMQNITPIARQAFGDKAQMVKTCEELGELTTALCKRLNGSPIEDEAIIDEIADVILMANQMRLIFGPTEVDERILFKISRTLKFINNGMVSS